MGGCHGAGDPREEIRKAFCPALCCTLSPGLHSRITWVQNLITFSSVHPNVFLPLCPRRLPIRLVVERRAVGRIEGYCAIPSITPSSSAPLIYTTTATLLTPQCLLWLKLQPLWKFTHGNEYPCVWWGMMERQLDRKVLFLKSLSSVGTQSRKGWSQSCGEALPLTLSGCLVPSGRQLFLRLAGCQR